MLRATGPWFIIKGMWLLGSNSGKLSSSLCGISVAKWFGRGIFSRFYRSVQKRRPPLLVNSQQFWMTSWVILPTASVALEDPNVSSHFFVFFLKYQFCLSHFQPNSPTTARAKCYNTLDAYCRLIALLVRHSGDASNNVTKINLLSRVSISEVRKHGWRPEIEFILFVIALIRWTGNFTLDSMLSSVHPGPVSQKSRKLFGPEKPFVKLRPANSVKPFFLYFVKGIKI